MFRGRTVFVLRAGASWHYGYPTGERLVDRIVQNAQRLKMHCNERIRRGMTPLHVPQYVAERIRPEDGNYGGRKAWESVEADCGLLIDRLRTVKPLVIDYFLGWNKPLQSIGKLMISAAILECEAMYLRESCNLNHKYDRERTPIQRPEDSHVRPQFFDDAWCRFVTHKLVMGCATADDLLKNRVNFITFNYDTSLEQQLLTSLNSIDLVHGRANEFLETENRVIHVYGSVRDPSTPMTKPINLEALARLGEQTDPERTNLVTSKDLIDAFYDASKRLKTIDPHDKDDKDVTASTTALLKSAKSYTCLVTGSMRTTIGE